MGWKEVPRRAHDRDETNRQMMAEPTNDESRDASEAHPHPNRANDIQGNLASTAEPSNIHVIEATLVMEEPAPPVYDAVLVREPFELSHVNGSVDDDEEDDDDGSDREKKQQGKLGSNNISSNNNNDSTSFWKRHKLAISLGVLAILLFGGLMATIGAVLASNENGNATINDSASNNNIFGGDNVDSFEPTSIPMELPFPTTNPSSSSNEASWSPSPSSIIVSSSAIPTPVLPTAATTTRPPTPPPTFYTTYFPPNTPPPTYSSSFSTGSSSFPNTNTPTPPPTFSSTFTTDNYYVPKTIIPTPPPTFSSTSSTGYYIPAPKNPPSPRPTFSLTSTFTTNSSNVTIGNLTNSTATRSPTPSPLGPQALPLTMKLFGLPTIPTFLPPTLISSRPWNTTNGSNIGV